MVGIVGRTVHPMNKGGGEDPPITWVQPEVTLPDHLIQPFPDLRTSYKLHRSFDYPQGKEQKKNMNSGASYLDLHLWTLRKKLPIQCQQPPVNTSQVYQLVGM